MAHKKLSDYERQRLETIQRNKEMMAALKIHSKLDQLSSSNKRPRLDTKSYKTKSPDKKPKTPLVIRRSLRTRGIQPDFAGGLKDDLVVSHFNVPADPPTNSLSGQPHSFKMKDVYLGTNSDQPLTQTIFALSKDQHSGNNRAMGSVDLKSLTLEPDNVARVMLGRILNVKFFPTTNINMIATGNKFGDVAFWNVDSANEDADGIYLYHPHSAPVSAILIQPFAFSKIITSCYNGLIRVMDTEKEMFNVLYASDDAIFSLSQRPSDMKCLYIGEGHGGINIWDEKTGKSSSSWVLHENRINSIDFNAENPNIMVTSSTDGDACIWDVRSIKKSKTLKTFHHERAVHSAYFSPSGSCIATTSLDNNIGILSGVNYEDVSMIHHNNQTGRWISSFRGIWGWDDSHVFIGNMQRGIDVISSANKHTVMTLQSEHMSAIPCRFDAHPYNVGMLAGSTAGGQVYLWKLS